jgi:hypothetical protein
MPRRTKRDPQANIMMPDDIGNEGQFQEARKFLFPLLPHSDISAVRDMGLEERGVGLHHILRGLANLLRAGS